jgi:hypothetical protein
MPDITSYNGIDMGDIASINGQDIASSGGAYNPVTDEGTYTETVPTTKCIAYGTSLKGPIPSSLFDWRPHKTVLNLSSDKDGIFEITQANTKNWSIIETSERIFAGIDTDGKLWMQAYSSAYVHQNHTANTVLTQVTSLSGASDTGWTDVSVSIDFVLAINGGKLFVVGENGDGQLGTGNTTDVSTLTQIGGSGGDTDWYKVSAGDDHSAAIKGASGNRSLLTTGENNNGKCGSEDTSGDDTSWTERVAADSGEDWTFVEAGYTHTAAILAGKLFVTGYGLSERFGNDSSANVLSFTQTGRTSSGGAFATNWHSCAIGNYQAMYLNTDGEVWHAGAGYNTGSGVNSSAQSGYHVKTSGNATAGTIGSLGGSDNFTAIKCDRLKSSGYKMFGGINNGKLYTWGEQNYTQTSYSSPAPWMLHSTSNNERQGGLQNGNTTCNAFTMSHPGSGTSILYAAYNS